MMKANATRTGSAAIMLPVSRSVAVKVEAQTTHALERLHHRQQFSGRLYDRQEAARRLQVGGQRGQLAKSHWHHRSDRAKVQ